MFQLRPLLYRFYWKLEQIIVPGLRSSQYAYCETLRRFTRDHPVWLDLGCGHHVFGWWMEHEQAEAVGESKLVVGLDYDLPSLYKHQAIRHLMVGDVARLPFADATFDLISANMVVEHLQDPAASLAEIRRILKPGGVFVFHTPNYWNFWVFLGSLAPSLLKVAMAALLEGRGSADVFPTRYRMNTDRAVYQHAAGAGFEVQAVNFVSTSAGTAMLGPLVAFELLLLRLLERPGLSRYRTDLIGILRRPPAAPSQSSAAPPAFFPAVSTRF